MTEIKTGCTFCKTLGGCPLQDYIEAGDMLSSGKFWCGDKKQQAECGNKVHEIQARPVSHRAAHGRNVHKVDMPRSTSTGSIETAQSVEDYLLFQETQNKQRQIIQKHGYDIS